MAATLASPLPAQQPTAQSTPAHLGIFSGQTDVGHPSPPGSATFDPATGTYTLTSAGYNIWYGRDELHFVWTKMVRPTFGISAIINFPNPASYKGAKAVLMIRQSLDDDSAGVAAAMHSDGTTILQFRSVPGGPTRNLDFRIVRQEAHPDQPRDPAVRLLPYRLELQKAGDSFSLRISLDGEPPNQFGPPIHLHLTEPVYVGIGFGSHVPNTLDSATFSNVMIRNP